MNKTILKLIISFALNHPYRYQIHFDKNLSKDFDYLHSDLIIWDLQDDYCKVHVSLSQDDIEIIEKMFNLVFIQRMDGLLDIDGRLWDRYSIQKRFKL